MYLPSKPKNILAQASQFLCQNFPFSFLSFLLYFPHHAISAPQFPAGVLASCLTCKTEGACSDLLFFCSRIPGHLAGSTAWDQADTAPLHKANLLLQTGNKSLAKCLGVSYVLRHKLKSGLLKQQDFVVHRAPVSSQRSHAEILLRGHTLKSQPSVDAIWRWGLRRWLHHERGALPSGVRALGRRHASSLAFWSVTWEYRKMSSENWEADTRSEKLKRGFHSLQNSKNRVSV